MIIDKHLNIKNREEYKWLWNRIHKKSRNIIRMSPNEATILHKFCSEAETGIVEIGRKFGGSTYVICKCSNVPVYSVDKGKWANSEKSIINKCIEEFQSRLNVINCKSVKAIIPQKYDVLFIDGDHSYDGVMRDIKTHWNKLTNVCIFHDYRSCRGVKKAVDYIISENVAEVIVPSEEKQNIIVVKKIKDLTDSF
jgi:hypothetical protein